MVLTWIAIFSAIVAVVSAFVAGFQAREARRQAESAREAAQTARHALLNEIVSECLENRRTAGEWQSVLDSHTELTQEERKELDRRVRIRIHKG